MDIDPKNWIDHKNADDLSACALNLPNSAEVAVISHLLFCNQEHIRKYNIGPGDEVFMTGRFVNHEGRQKNLPMVRFGNISMVPLEPVETERGLLQECFLIEVRSLPGYSGSPVFLNPLPIVWGDVRRDYNVPLRLLGIDFAHLPHESRVIDQKTKKPVDDKWIVKENSGIAGVVPAWKLAELLDAEEFLEERRKAKQSGTSHPVAVFDKQVKS